MNVETLINKGYSINLIGQLSKLESFLDEKTILEFISPDVPISYIEMHIIYYKMILLKIIM